MASRGTRSNGRPDALGTGFRAALDHPLLGREGEHALGRELQAATRDIEAIAVEIPLTARALLDAWDRHRARERTPSGFGAVSPEAAGRLEAAMGRLRAALHAVDAAPREAERAAARRRVGRALRAAELRFERIETALPELRRRAAELETARRRGDRTAQRRLGRAFGLPIRSVRRRLPELEDAISRRESARSALVLHNLRLVTHQAWPFRNRGVAFGDLVQDGILGLMRAAEKFDPELGHRFSTYAGWWIQQSLRRCVQKHGRTVRVPSHVGARLRRLLELRSEVWLREGREPEVEQLAREAGLAVSDAERSLEHAQAVISLDVGGDGADDRPLIDRLGHEADPAVAPDHHRLAREIGAALERLPRRDAEIVRLRFGLDQEEPRTLAEIGRSRGISRERTRKIEKRALERMRELLRDRRLGEDLLEEMEE